MPTSFENFVNTELPKRISTNESPTTPQAGDIPVFTGVGLLTESKTASEAGLATETFATNAANAAKSYADDLITSIYKFQTTYNPQTTGNFPTTANTVGGVAIKKGFTWVVSGVTGQYTFQGVTVDNGDTLLALVDDASSTSASDWHITEKNLGYTPENVSNKYSNDDLEGGVGTYPETPNVKTYVDNGLSGKQNTLADVITADTYGSSTQYPVITFNAKGIATDVTLQTVPTPTFTDANFSVQKAGSPSITASWSLTALTASRVHTYPDKAINFGDLSFIATTNNNNLSGTNCRILGGSNNTVSGTDVVAVGCNGCDLSMYTNNVTAIGLQSTTNSYAAAPRQAILLGSSALTTSIFNISGAHAAALGVIQCVYSDVCLANGTTYNATLDGVNTPSSTNCIKLMPSASVLSSAVIDLDFIIVIGDNMSGALLAPRRTVFAKRRVYVVFAFNDSDVGAFNSSVEVIGTDTSVGSAATGTVTVGVTVDSANNRLIPTVSATSGSKQTLFQFGVRSTAHYNRNV